MAEVTEGKKCASLKYNVLAFAFVFAFVFSLVFVVFAECCVPHLILLSDIVGGAPIIY